jgi:photosystem II stability/assembly factor-like uncharacterized protein
MKTLSLLLLAVFTVTGANAQGWNWLNPKPTGNDYRSVVFVDTNTGYAVGDFGTIIKTTDGGTHWTLSASGTAQHLNSVYFTDFSTGYVAGDGGVILKTTDGGAIWTSQYSGTSNQR